MRIPDVDHIDVFGVFKERDPRDESRLKAMSV